MSTDGAAQSIEMLSRAIRSNTTAASTLGRQTCTAPTAVTVHVNVHPLA